MNSGLYAFAGDSATATEAACANRFDEPMTNVSKVYFGFSRLPPVSAGVVRRSPRPVPGPIGRGGGGTSSSIGTLRAAAPCAGRAADQLLAASYPASYAAS